MGLRNTVFTYGILAKLFHWLTALAVVGMLVVGFIMVGMEKGPQKMELYGIHKAIGALILITTALRLLWRQMSIVPALPGELSTLERIAAHGSHAALYFMLFFMPLAGWGASSAAGYPVSVFGWFTLPNLIGKSKVWASTLAEMHYYGAFLFIALITVHILAGLYHHFIRGDNVFRRMMPW